MARKKITEKQRSSQRRENKRRKQKSPAGFASPKAEERRLYAIARRRAKQRIEEAVDRVMERYIKRALEQGGAQVLMHIVDRFVPAAPRVIIVERTSTKSP